MFLQPNLTKIRIAILQNENIITMALSKLVDDIVFKVHCLLTLVGTVSKCLGYNCNIAYTGNEVIPCNHVRDKYCPTMIGPTFIYI